MEDFTGGIMGLGFRVQGSGLGILRGISLNSPEPKVPVHTRRTSSRRVVRHLPGDPGH